MNFVIVPYFTFFVFIAELELLRLIGGQNHRLVVNPNIWDLRPKTVIIPGKRSKFRKKTKEPRDVPNWIKSSITGRLLRGALYIPPRVDHRGFRNT